MKKLSAPIFTALLVTVMLCFVSCVRPPMGDTTVTDDRFYGDGEEWYYHVRGVEIVREGESPETYYTDDVQGARGYVKDCVFRLKFELEDILAAGYDDGTYTEYLALADALLDGKLPRCLIPAVERTDVRRPDTSWVKAFTSFFERYPEAALADSALMRLFRFECSRRSRQGLNSLLEGMPRLRAELIEEAPVIKSVRYDGALRRNVVDADIPEGKYVIAAVGQKEIASYCGNYYVFAPGEQITLRADISGTVAFAFIGEGGIIGDSAVYDISDTGWRKLMSAEKVTFDTPVLELGVRRVLGKADGEELTYADLSDISAIDVSSGKLMLWVNGYVNEDALSGLPEIGMKEFFVSDFDKFPCLEAVTVMCHYLKADDLTGGWVKNTDRINLSLCSLGDISGFRGSHVMDLTLVGNRITDATVLESCLSLDSLYMTSNPLKRISLPRRYISFLMLGDTDLTSADFLNNIAGCGELNIRNTAIVDCTPALRFCLRRDDTGKSATHLALADSASAKRGRELYPGSNCFIHG